MLDGLRRNRERAKKWKMRYFVVSEGVLSYFQRADPRPYRLVSQIVLRDAKITTLEGNMLSLDLQGQERLLRFNDRGELVRWKAIIDKGNIDLIQDQDFEKLDDMIIQEHFDPGTVSDGMMNEKPLKGVRGARAKFLKNAALFLSAKNQANKGMQRAKNATEARMKSIRSGAGLLIRGVRGNSNSSERRRPTNEMLLSSTKNLDSRNEKREPTVQAVVEMNNTFKVWSKLNENAEQKNEILLIVRVKLYQAFLLSGGQYGRLACGDELLLMEFSAGIDDVQTVFFQPPTSL